MCSKYIPVIRATESEKLVDKPDVKAKIELGL